MWATVFLVPAFFLQGGAPAPQFDVGSGVPGLSAARYPGAPQLQAGGAGWVEVDGAGATLSPTTQQTSTFTSRPRAAPTTVAVQPTTSTSSTLAELRTTSSPTPSTTTVPASTTTTLGGVVVSLPSNLRPAQQPAGRTDRGVASWFGAPHRTCAHRTLPFGTMIKVTRISTGATTECRVADWGPADTTRVIDLSTDTFEQLADASVGLIEVVIEW